jgi:tRNA threonylcarbamoyladenosine biosynthesis protein TsaE
MQVEYSLDKINDVAQQLISQFSTSKIWLFTAQMGCGKTTLINHLCQHLQVLQATSSPTYSIINEYKTENCNTIFHIDLYRINSLEEALDAGIEDVLFSNNFCFIEWPNIITTLLPNDYISIEINITNTGERQLIANQITQ